MPVDDGWDMNNSSGGGEDSGSIGKRLKKGPVEREDLFVNSSILRLKFYGSRRGSTSRGRGRRDRDRSVAREDIVSDGEGIGTGSGDTGAGSSVCSR